MINVTRGSQVPDSLNSSEIRDYIQLAVLHLNSPDINAKPEKPVSYRSSDLLDAFDTTFFSKCYLTEQSFQNSYIMDIEHFIGQAERPDLVYEWSNLFPAEHLTNMIKPRVTPSGGYLNPCDPNDDVETEIIYALCSIGEMPNFEPLDATNSKAVNTCNLLNRVHNGHDENSRRSTASLRHAIHKKYIEILNKIIDYQRESDVQSRFQLKVELKSLLSRRSSFTMLCRSIPAVRMCLDSSFLD